MGSVVSADDAREAQIEDGTKALANARARGGQVQIDAETKLAPVLALVAATEEEASALAQKAIEARARRGVANDAADAVVVEALDDMFEAGGRTRNDPIMAVAAPGGATPITAAALESQPVRMKLVAKVLARLAHPKIAPELLQAASARIAQAADPLAKVVRETADAIIEAEMADQVLTALARLVRNELMGLKRMWIGRGMKDSEIHEIIPDRPDRPEQPPKKKDD